PPTPQPHHSFPTRRSSDLAAEKLVDTGYALGAPGFGVLQRAHKHFVEPERISAVFVHHVIWIGDVAAGFGHFLAVFAKNEALVRSEEHTSELQSRSDLVCR